MASRSRISFAAAVATLLLAGCASNGYSGYGGYRSSYPGTSYGGAYSGIVVAPAIRRGYYDDRRYDDRYYDRRYDGGRLVRCESHDERTRFCRVDTRQGVRLVNQLSRSPCIEGRTWGADRGGLWVSRGCRGQFLVGSSRYGSGYGDRYRYDR